MDKDVIKFSELRAILKSVESFYGASDMNIDSATVEDIKKQINEIMLKHLPYPYQQQLNQLDTFSREADFLTDSHWDSVKV